MNTIIQSIRDFDVSKVKYGEPKVLESTMKAIPISVNDNPIFLQIPQCVAPYGMNCYNNDSGDSYDINVSFKDMDSRETLKIFYNKISEFDKRNVDQAIKNSQTYLKKPSNTSRDVVEALYTTMIKYPKDKDTGEITDKYPPTFKLKIPTKQGQFNCDFYDENKEKITNILDVNTKGAKVVAIIQCTGLWVINGKFGCTWKVVQMQVFSTKELVGFAIKQEADDLLDSSDEEDDDMED